MSCERGCPKVEEYGGRHSLSRFCDICLYHVLIDSSSDWKHYKRVTKKLERSKMVKDYLEEIGSQYNFITFKNNLK